MSPRVDLDRCVKSRPHRDSIPGTLQSVASRYTDCTTRPKLGRIPGCKSARFEYFRHHVHPKSQYKHTNQQGVQTVMSIILETYKFLVTLVFKNSSAMCGILSSVTVFTSSVSGTCPESHDCVLHPHISFL